MIHLSRQFAETLTACARAESPSEACALISEGKGRLHLWDAPNSASEPERAFEIAAEDLRERIEWIDRRGERLVAVFHSHPNGASLEPSRRDREIAALWPKLTWVIGNEAGEFWVGEPGGR